MNRTRNARGWDSSGRDESSVNKPQAQQQQQLQALEGHVAILWDMENCGVPSEVKADDVAGNIRMALREHPVIQGVVNFFSAYGDFNHFPKKVREGCQRTGVNLIDVPKGKKDASDKAILVDMFLFALDNPPPCTIFLISGDVDFAPALHKLSQRGYTVILAVPSGVGVSSALCSAGLYVWDWPTLAKRGDLNLAKSVTSKDSPSSSSKVVVSAEEKMAEIPETNGPPAWNPSDDSEACDDQDEKIVWKSPTPHNYAPFDECEGAVARPQLETSPVPPPVAPPVKAQEPELTAKRQPKSGGGANPATQVAKDGRGSAQNVAVQTKNIHNLRDQLVRMFNGANKLEVVRVTDEYQKQYGRPVAVSEYGCSDLITLLERLQEWLFIKGEGNTRTLNLTRSGSRLAAKLRKDAAKNIISAQREEAESNMADAEAEPEEAVVGAATQNVPSLIDEPQTLIDFEIQSPAPAAEEPRKRGKEGLKDSHKPQVAQEWGFGSHELKDEPQEEKDVEMDKSILEPGSRNADHLGSEKADAMEEGHISKHREMSYLEKQQLIEKKRQELEEKRLALEEQRHEDERKDRQSQQEKMFQLMNLLAQNLQVPK